MYVRDMPWHGQMLYCLKAGNVILEGCVFPVLAHGGLRAAGWFCTLGKTHYMFITMEVAWGLELNTPGFKWVQMVLTSSVTWASHLSSLNHDLTCTVRGQDPFRRNYVLGVCTDNIHHGVKPMGGAH